MNLQTIEDWQLNRVLTKIERERIPGYYALGFILHEGGVSLLQVSHYRISEIKTMSQEDLKFYHETWFRQRHFAVKVNYKGKELLVGFWADDQDGLEAKLKELLPHDENSGIDSAESSNRGIRLGSNQTN